MSRGPLKARSAGALLAAALVAFAVQSAGSPAFAATWTTGLASGSSGESQGQAAPAAPANPTATCTSGLSNTVNLTWSAVTHATTYTVYDSTTSASTGYAVLTSGVTTTSYTTGALSSASYWFEIAAYVGTNWVSANSAATAKRTIFLITCG
jgi:hypothetical protein